MEKRLTSTTFLSAERKGDGEMDGDKEFIKVEEGEKLSKVLEKRAYEGCGLKRERKFN